MMRRISNLNLNRNILLICVGFFLVFFGFSSAQQYLVPLLEIQKKTNMALVSLILIYFSFFVTNFFGPKIVSAFGTKNSLLTGSVVYILFPLSVTLGNEFTFYFFSILQGIGGALFWQSSAQIIAENSSQNTAGRNLGFLSSSFLFGTFVGIAAAAPFAKHIPLQTLYISFSLATALSIPFFLKVNNTKNKAGDLKKFSFSYLRNPKLLLLFPPIFSSYFFSALTFSAIGLIILKKFGIELVGIFASLDYISRIIGALTAGKISDVFSKSKIITISLGLGLVGIILFLFAESVYIAAFSIILLALFISTIYPVCLALFKNTTSTNDYKYSTGAFFVFSSSGTLTALFFTRFLNLYAGFFLGILFLITSFFAIYNYNRIFKA